MLLRAAFTLLLFAFLEKGVRGLCSTLPINQAVYEGTLDIPMICNRHENAVWQVNSTSDEPTTITITNSSDYVNPSLTDIYGANQTGLFIKKATTSPGTDPIATAGLYIIANPTSVRQGAKLLVVREVPTCTCNTVNSASLQMNCSVMYADSSFHPINAIMSWTSNGSFYSSHTTNRTRVNTYWFVSTSTITVDANVPANYKCTVTFARPTNIQYAWVATNAPEFTASCSVPCQKSRGSLTRKPANTADVAGSSNITLECASSYGTNATLWYFTPFDAYSKGTIGISRGYELLQPNEQQYELRASINSSILVVRELSNFTVGTYSCNDYMESASALLLVIPAPVSVEPLFGPIAGGTKITMIDSAIIDNLLRYVGGYISYKWNVTNIYIGNDLSSTSVSLSIDSSTSQLVAVTPNTTETSVGQPMPIVIGLWPTPVNISFNRAFTYLPNPNITDLYPTSFVVTGGTLLTVTGQSLSSVAKPIIRVTVLITRAAANNSTSYTSTRGCTVQNGNQMMCPMPPLNIPDEFLEILNAAYNSSTSREKRSINQINWFSAGHHSSLSRLIREVSVQSVSRLNGTDHLNISLGIFLDGYRVYENINKAFPNTKISFYSAPEINSSNQLIEFDPATDELIYIKGNYMMRGCRLDDYLVYIGSHICNNSDLQDNQLSCRPPKVKPPSTVNDTIYCDQHLSVTIILGYIKYQYACLTYTDQASTRKVALIIGLTVGLTGFVIFLAILIVCIVRCCRGKSSKQPDNEYNSERQETRNPDYDYDLRLESSHYDVCLKPYYRESIYPNKE